MNGCTEKGWNYLRRSSSTHVRLRYSADFSSDCTDLVLTALADSAYNLAARWDLARSSPTLDQFSAHDIKSFNSNQVALFLDTVEQQEKYSSREINKMNEVYSLDVSGNDEIRVNPPLPSPVVAAN